MSKFVELIKKNTNTYSLHLPIMDKDINIRPLKVSEVKYISQSMILDLMDEKKVKEYDDFEKYEKDYKDNIKYFYKVLTDIINEDIEVSNLAFLDFMVIMFYIKQISNAMTVDGVNITCSECNVRMDNEIFLDKDLLEYVNKENLNGFTINTKEFFKSQYNMSFVMKNPKISDYHILLYIKAKKSEKDLDEKILKFIYKNTSKLVLITPEEQMVADREQNNMIPFEEYQQIFNEIFAKLNNLIFEKYFKSMSMVDYKVKVMCPNCQNEMEINFKDKDFS
jgi:hypothetical protein